MSENETNYFYRFRSLDKLLGEKYKELEKQELVYSKFEDLNDPMDGLKQLYWEGDEILWKNLIRHYVGCVLTTMKDILLGSVSDKYVPVDCVYQFRDSPKFKAVFLEACDAYFSIEKYKVLPAQLAKMGRIGREELITVLTVMHNEVLEVIDPLLVKHGLKEKLIFGRPTGAAEISTLFFHALKEIDNNEKEKEQGLTPKLFMKLLKTMSDSNDYDLYRNSKPGTNQFFLTRGLSKEYVNQLEALMYPNCYTISFTEDYTNPSVWAHYANAHEGVCLKFKASKTKERDYPHIYLKKNDENEYQPNSFQKVNYTTDNILFNFFTCLGKLPIPLVLEYWYMDNGKISEIGKRTHENMDSWRKKYWDQLHKCLVTKMPDWAYEKEYRMIIYPYDNFNEVEKRKFTYKFSDLEGIIFGVKTPMADQVKIMDIIFAKCKKEDRKTFKFYKSVLNAQTGKVDVEEIPIFKVPQIQKST